MMSLLKRLVLYVRTSRLGWFASLQGGTKVGCQGHFVMSAFGLLCMRVYEKILGCMVDKQFYIAWYIVSDCA